MVLNYNNNRLVEIYLTYQRLGHFIRGIPVQNFFSAHFARLRAKVGWLSKGEIKSFAVRYHVGMGAVSVFFQTYLETCKRGGD